ncbi:MAG: hypothetical protein R3B48_21050 [Kofleriaceae bacterium]
MPGHETGHDVTPPVGFDWGGYVHAFVEEHGGWTALCDELMRRAQGAEDFPLDLQVLEKGVRRLAKRGQKTGGQYGRWMIRYLGVPSSLARWAAWMGQLHSRFSDLPSSLRWEQLSLWDRPPVTESRIAAWIHVGMSSVLLRMRAEEDAERRLTMAERGAAQAGAACRLEVALLRAKLCTDAGDRATAEALFDAAEALLPSAELSLDDRRCYEARLLGQRAYHLTRPLPGAAEDLRGALALFERIEDEPVLPFVAFRKCNGLAYCHWKLGDVDAGQRWARLAEAHAGDGGFVRFRIMALNLLSRMVPADEGAPLRARAERLARLLEDEDLLRRVRARW